MYHASSSPPWEVSRLGRSWVPAEPRARTALVHAGLGKGREVTEPAGNPLYYILSAPLSFPNFYRSLLFSGNIFNQQPSYYNDLDESLPTILQVPALSLPRGGRAWEADPSPPVVTLTLLSLGEKFTSHTPPSPEGPRVLLLTHTSRSFFPLLNRIEL